MNNTAQSIEQLIHSDPAYYHPLLLQAREENNRLSLTFRDQPHWISGWLHDFACPDCAGALHFDPDMNYNPPNLFVCPHCGKQLQDAKLDDAWIYCYRAHIAKILESAAACALMGEKAALKTLERFFDFYADHYAGFPVHGHASGKIMPQVLDEAVWCLQVLQAFYPCRKLFPKEKLEKWFNLLFDPLAHLINEPELQKTIHNHVLWHKCALGAIALCFEKEALLHHALEEQWGVREQVAKGFTQDGFWREGSVLYHFYALEALTGFYRLLSHEHPDPSISQILEKAYLAPLSLSWDGWHLPSINDGWYPLTLERFAPQFHQAASATGSRQLWEQVARIREKCPKVLARPAALLMDQPKKAAEIWAGTGLAIFQKPWMAVLKSGVLTRSHMHRDYLSLTIPPFSVDLGTPGYGHPLYRSWYKLCPAHNTIAVDGDQPDRALPNHLEETEGGVRAVVDGGWEPVLSASRTLTADRETFSDRTEVLCSGEHVIDWFFSAEGTVAFSHTPGESVTLSGGPGYEHLQNIRSISCDTLTASFTLENRVLTLTIPAKELEVFTAQAPGNPAHRLRTVLILRKRGEKAIFQATYTQALKP